MEIEGKEPIRMPYQCKSLKELDLIASYNGRRIAESGLLRFFFSKNFFRDHPDPDLPPLPRLQRAPVFEEHEIVRDPEQPLPPLPVLQPAPGQTFMTLIILIYRGLP